MRASEGGQFQEIQHLYNIHIMMHSTPIDETNNHKKQPSPKEDEGIWYLRPNTW